MAGIEKTDEQAEMEFENAIAMMREVIASQGSAILEQLFLRDEAANSWLMSLMNCSFEIGKAVK